MKLQQSQVTHAGVDLVVIAGLFLRVQVAELNNRTTMVPLGVAYSMDQKLCRNVDEMRSSVLRLVGSVANVQTK